MGKTVKKTWTSFNFELGPTFKFKTPKSWKKLKLLHLRCLVPTRLIGLHATRIAWGFWRSVSACPNGSTAISWIERSVAYWIHKSKLKPKWFWNRASWNWVVLQNIGTDNFQVVYAVGKQTQQSKCMYPLERLWGLWTRAISPTIPAHKPLWLKFYRRQVLIKHSSPRLSCLKCESLTVLRQGHRWRRHPLLSREHVSTNLRSCAVPRLIWSLGINSRGCGPWRPELFWIRHLRPGPVLLVLP